MAKTSLGGTSLTRLGLEALAIVASILLAFTVDAWWERESELDTEMRVMQSLLEEFRINSERLDTLRAYHSGIEASAVELLRLSADGDVGISQDSVDHLISDLLWGGGGKWATGTLDALLASGDLGLIRNEDLRTKLAAWPRTLERVRGMEQGDFYTQRELLYPFLVRRGYLPKISNAIREAPGYPEPYEYAVPLPLSAAALDHRGLLQDREFQNLVLLRQWDQSDYRWGYAEFTERMSEIVTLLEAELGR